VYAVEEGGTRYAPVLRELSSERVAVSMFGSDWARYVIDIEPTLYTHYMLGEPMVATEAVDTSILKPQR
jgi:hypothetical protein